MFSQLESKKEPREICEVPFFVNYATAMTLLACGLPGFPPEIELDFLIFF